MKRDTESDKLVGSGEGQKEPKTNWRWKGRERVTNWC